MMFPAVHPRFVARSLNIGAFFNVLFGTLWLGNGVNSLQLMLAFVAFALIAAASAALLIAAARLVRQKTAVPEPARAVSRYVNAATSIQLAVSFIGAPLLGIAGYAQLVLPAIVLSVGLYFLALAPALRVAHYSILGGLLTALPVGAVLLAPADDLTALVGIGGVVMLLMGAINVALVPRLRNAPGDSPAGAV